jgi:hypothetical protein
MDTTNICSKNETDYFVIESVTDNSGSGITIEKLKELGLQFYLIFHKDGSIDTMQGVPMSGTWNENTITLTAEEDGETIVIILPFSIEGDLLKYERDGETWRFIRSDETPAFCEATGGGTIAEIEITDGFVTGHMSVICPGGWYYHQQTLMEGLIRLSVSPLPLDTAVSSIAIEYCIKECAKHTIEGEKGETTIEDKEWSGVYNEENAEIEMISYIGDSAITIKIAGEEAMAVLEQIMTTVQLTWNTEQSNLAICEGKEYDFFKMRSLSTPERTAHHVLLKTLGYDWCILFNKDGSVRAKFDRAVNCFWGDGFEDVVSGSWKNNMMTFIGGDNNTTGNLAFTLEKDILSVTFADTNNTTVTFRRGDDTPPDFITNNI